MFAQHLPHGCLPRQVAQEALPGPDPSPLRQLGIANITYDKREQEMVINDEFSTPLIITIVTLAGSLLLIAAIYGCCHQRFSQKKDQVRWERGGTGIPGPFFVPKTSSAEGGHRCCHHCWWRHPGLSSWHHPCVLLRGCPTAADALEGQELLPVVVREGSSRMKNQGQGNEVVVVE